MPDLPQKCIAAIAAHLEAKGWKTLGKMDRKTLETIIRREWEADIKANTPKLVSRLHEEIYEAYPRHVGRDAALRSIARACKKTDPAWLLQKTIDYRDAVNRWPRNFRFDQSNRDLVPHPSTWFTQGRYSDDPSEWEPQKTPAPGSRVVKNSSPEEPDGWVAVFLQLWGENGWEVASPRSVKRAGEVKFWADLGPPLNLWPEILEAANTQVTDAGPVAQSKPKGERPGVRVD